MAMSSSPLSDCLRQGGVLTADVLDAALARQAVYGGALDTALLELQALDEPTLWSALAVATGVPVPGIRLFENPDPGAALRFDSRWSRRCRAVPVGERDGNLQLLCSEPIDDSSLAEACTTLGVSVEIYVVPEVRLAAARQVVYGEPVPPRLLRLLARLLGAQAVRRWVEAQTRPAPAPAAARAPAPAAPAPAPPATRAAEAERAPAPAPPSPAPAPTLAPAAVLAVADAAPAATEFEVSAPSFPRSAPTPVGRATSAGELLAAIAHAQAPPVLAAQPNEEQLCREAQAEDPDVHVPALRALRARLGHPRVRALTEKLRRDLAGTPDAAATAAAALSELRDPEAVPALMAALAGPSAVADAARKALVEISKQDFGQSRRRWGAWWDRHRGDGRMEWLFDGLAHKAPEIRFASSEELRALTGEYFGYHFDLPRRERDDARERWRSWWYDSGGTGNGSGNGRAR
jgi:hypothetical protein